MKFQDHTSSPCSCPECQQAGVTHRPQVRDPQSGKKLHGYQLKRYWDHADEALARIKKLVEGKGWGAERTPEEPHK